MGCDGKLSACALPPNIASAINAAKTALRIASSLRRINLAMNTASRKRWLELRATKR